MMVTQDRYFIDIGIASETGSVHILVPDVMLQSGVSLSLDQCTFLPVRVASGSVLVARAQEAQSETNVLRGGLTFYQRGAYPLPSLARCFVDGINLATTRGTNIDPGGNANQYPAGFTTVSSSWPECAKWMLALMGSGTNTGLADAQWVVQIAIGDAGSEVVIAMLRNWSSAAADYMPNGAASFPVDIPKGARVSARARTNITNATDRVFDLALYGLN
jgi:hypothetical protein